VNVTGADFLDTKDVPHGAVSAVTYYSKALRRFRRMHVYTPPGYESGKGRFRSSICCTGRAIAMRRGVPWAAPGSSLTT